MQVFKGEDYKDVIGATSDDYGKYFSNTSPFYDEKWSPFNLGILTPMEKHEIYLQAA